MSIEPTAWLDGETTDTLDTVPPASGADPTPWGVDELNDSAALPEVVEEGEEPTPVPPDDPTPWPTADLVNGGGSCCCPTPPVSCYCLPSNTVCVTITGLPTDILSGAATLPNINGTWTYVYGPTTTFLQFGVSTLNAWVPETPFVSTQAASGTTACSGVPPGTGGPLAAVTVNSDYGPGWGGGFTYPYNSWPLVSCSQRDGLDQTGVTTAYTYFAGWYAGRRTPVTSCADNSYPGAPPTLGLSYDWNLERDELFVGWTAASLVPHTGPFPPGTGGAGTQYTANLRPPAPTVVSCTADEIVLTVPWVRWRYREDGIHTQTRFFAPGGPSHNGTEVYNTLEEGTCTVTITRGSCLTEGPADPGGGGGGMGLVRQVREQVERMMAADPLLRAGCCGD